MQDKGSGTGLEGHPEKPLIYASHSMQERRKRILHEARTMMAEGDLKAFNLRALCKRAGVAERTVYNAFGNKDRIMALAIREAYEDANLYIRYRTSPDTLEGIIDRLVSANGRNLKAPNYTRAVTAIYFSPAASADVWNALRSMVYLDLRQWLARVDAEDGLQDWVDVEELAGDIANIGYAKINDWVHGRLTVDEYARGLVTAVLTYAVGATRGPHQESATRMLREIRRTGKLPEFPNPVYAPPSDANCGVHPSPEVALSD